MVGKGRIKVRPASLLGYVEILVKGCSGEEVCVIVPKEYLRKFVIGLLYNKRWQELLFVK